MQKKTLHIGLITLFSQLFFTPLFAQVYKVPAEVVDSDTFAVYNYHEIVVYEKMPARVKRMMAQNEKLMKNLKIVMPYAKEVAMRLKKYDLDLLNLTTEKERKAYIEKAEKELFSEFEDDIIGMNHYQGRLLIKLIFRETGRTSYSIIQNYKSNFSAGFWQGFAKVFGYNLKLTYDPVEDAEIEVAIKMLGLD